MTPSKVETSAPAVATTASDAAASPRHAPADSARPSAPEGTSIGVCVTGEHPTLAGRALVRWRDADHTLHETWLPQMKGLLLRRGDRVLLTMPGNHDEPIVMGVLDGLGRRTPVPAATDGPLVKLAPNEALRVAAADGTPLLEVTVTENGPVVRLLAGAAGIDVPGTLKLSADDIELEARQGEIRVAAAGDVKVKGEVVRLN